METDPSRCALCGKPNNCAMADPNGTKTPCWCTAISIPDALLLRVPAPLRDRACICRACIDAHDKSAPSR